MDTRIQVSASGVSGPNINDYTSSIEMVHLDEKGILNDLKLFGSQSKSWEFLSLLTEMAERNRACLEEFSEKLMALKQQASGRSLPPTLKNKIAELDGYLSNEFERLIFTPAMIFLRYGHVFTRRRINSSLRHYAFDVFMHALKCAAIDIVRQCIDVVDVNNRAQAINDFNDLFQAVHIDIKENFLNLTRVCLLKDEHLDANIQTLLEKAQQIEYKTWISTANARAILEKHLIKAHQCIMLDCKANFGEYQLDFQDFWGVKGPFTLIPNTRFIGWSRPQFAWHWADGLDRLDYTNRAIMDSANSNSIIYVSKPVIDACLTPADKDQIDNLILDIPKSAVEVDGCRLGFLEAFNQKTEELTALSAAINKLPKSLFVGAALFASSPISPAPVPVQRISHLNELRSQRL